MIGAGATLGNFQARLGLDSSDYAKGMINAESVSRIFGQSFATFVSNPLLGSIGILKNVGKAFVSGSVEVLGYAESIERLSQQTGASEGLLIALQKRLEIAGFSAERAAQGMAFFNKFVAEYRDGGKAANELVGQLGVSLAGLEGTDAIFGAMIEAVSQIEDPALQASAAMRLFGRMGGPELVNAIGGGSKAIDEMIDQYTRLGFVVDRRTNSQLAALNTNLGFLQQAIEGVKLNTIREFLIGVTGDLDTTNEGVLKLSESINSELGPASREAGEFATNWLVGLGQLLGPLNDIADLLSGPLSFLVNAADNDNVSTLGGVRSATPEELHPEMAPIFRRNRERFAQEMEELGL